MTIIKQSVKIIVGASIVALVIKFRAAVTYRPSQLIIPIARQVLSFTLHYLENAK